jgi:hypothetical protein
MPDGVDLVAEEEVQEQMDDADVQRIVRLSIEDAVQFMEDQLTTDREKSAKYYRGEPLGNEEDGRSQVVSRDVAEAVHQIMPSLMRVFFSSENPCEFVPQGPEDVAQAEQATDMVSYIINESYGFDAFYAAFKDSLYQKMGIIKWWWDESDELTYHSFTGLTDEALGLLLQEEGIEPVSVNSTPDPLAVQMAQAQGLSFDELPADQIPQIHDVEIRRRTTKGTPRIMAVPPEEFLADPRARSVEDASLIAHRSLKTLSELVALGYPPEMVEDHLTYNDDFLWNTAEQTRQDWSFDYGATNPAQRRALYVEAYIPVDLDNDGFAEIIRFCTLGDSYEVVRSAPWGGEVPFAVFVPDPTPHSLWGSDIADQVMDLQRIKTMLQRGLLDSLALTLDPRIEAVEGQVNMTDLLDSAAVGGIVRVRAPGMLRDRVTPFVGRDALGVIGYFDEVRDARTGQHNLALEADALQSTTKAAVQAQVEGSRQRLELIARIYAESGCKRIYRGLLKLLARHQDKARMVRLRNEWVEVNPAVWDTSMDVTVNVGTGGLVEDRVIVLQQTLEAQKEILMTMGQNNPLVGLGQLRHTLGKLLEINGEKDTSRYFRPLPVDYEPPPQPEQPDPGVMLAEAEMIKAQSDAMNDQAKLQIEREKMLIDLKEIELKYGTMLDVAAMRGVIDAQKAMYAIDEKLVR